MKAPVLQRVLLYGLVLPLALLTVAWYMIQVITMFNANIAYSIGRTSLGPLGGIRTVVQDEPGLAPTGGRLGGTTTVTTHDVRTTYGRHPVHTSRYSYSYSNVKTPYYTDRNGDVRYLTWVRPVSTWKPTTMDEYGTYTTMGLFTDTVYSYSNGRVYTLRKRAVPTHAAEAAPSQQQLLETAPAPGPTPAPAPARAQQQARVLQRDAQAPEMGKRGHELVKRRRGGGGGRVGGGGVDEGAVKAAFQFYIPGLLGLIWSVVVTVWLLLRSCASPQPTIAADLAGLKALFAVGLLCVLYFTIAIAVSVGALGYDMWGSWIAIIVCGWLLLCALLAVCVWESRWAKRHAGGDLRRALADVDASAHATGIVDDTEHAENKWDPSPGSTPGTLPYHAYPVPASADPQHARLLPSPPPSSPPGQPLPPGSPGADSYTHQQQNAPPGPAPAGFAYTLVPLQGAQSPPPPGSPPPQQQFQQPWHQHTQGQQAQYAQPAAQSPQSGPRCSQPHAQQP